MSRANAQVKFPDGTIKHGIYNGTVDYYWEPLFETSEEAWDAWQEYYKDDNLDDSKWDSPLGTIYDVEIADDYGGGETYRTQATKSRITGEVEAEEMEKVEKGLPKWWLGGNRD